MGPNKGGWDGNVAGYGWASHVRNPHYVSNTIAYWLDAPSDGCD
jgi:hypothetical protein